MAAAVPILRAIALGMLGQPSVSVADACAAPVTFTGVKQIVDQRCHVCRSAKPQSLASARPQKA